MHWKGVIKGQKMEGWLIRKSMVEEWSDKDIQVPRDRGAGDIR